MKKLRSQGIVIIVLICAAHRLAKVHISLHFHPTVLGFSCSTIPFFCHPFQKELFWLLGEAKSWSNGALAWNSVNVLEWKTKQTSKQKQCRTEKSRHLSSTYNSLTTCQTFTKIPILGPWRGYVKWSLISFQFFESFFFFTFLLTQIVWSQPGY